MTGQSPDRWGEMAKSASGSARPAPHRLRVGGPAVGCFASFRQALPDERLLQEGYTLVGRVRKLRPLFALCC
jgi:hypothetical protein